MSSTDNAELSAILENYEASERQNNRRREGSLPVFRIPHSALLSSSPVPRSRSPDSPDRELVGVRRGNRGRPDLLDFKRTLHPRALTPVRAQPPSDQQISGVPQSGIREQPAPWRTLGQAKAYYRVQHGIQLTDANHNDLDQPFPNLNRDNLSEERRCGW